MLKSKSWILIINNFDFFDIFIVLKWEAFPYLIYVLKLIESKFKGDINLKLSVYDSGLRSIEDQKRKKNQILELGSHA